jgi:hypothetical protein
MIYTITTLKTIHVYRNPAHASELGCRCVGFFHKLEDAIETVEENYCDIYENGYYPFAVIEAVKEGMYNIGNNDEWWFQWKYDGYEQIEKPSVLKNTCGFGIG